MIWGIFDRFYLLIMIFRWGDREPDSESRICSCHFPHGQETGPCLFQWTKSHEVSFSSVHVSTDHNYATVPLQNQSADVNSDTKQGPSGVQFGPHQYEDQAGDESQQSGPVVIKRGMEKYSAAWLNDRVIRWTQGFQIRPCLKGWWGWWSLLRIPLLISVDGKWRASCWKIRLLWYWWRSPGLPPPAPCTIISVHYCNSQ